MLGPNLIVFRDTARQIPTEEMLDALQRAIDGLYEDQELLLDVLLLAGKIESGLSDCSCPGAEKAKPLTDAIAASLLKGQNSGLQTIARLAQELRSTDMPSDLRTSDLEGFSYYALHPLDSSDAATALYRNQNVAVIGIRTIGTVLSSVAAISLNQCGNSARRITVRPTGHPYDRKTHFTVREHAWVTEQYSCGAQFLIVDEGPGLSGSSFLSVAEALTNSGVARERITFLGSNDVDPSQLCALDAAERWKQFTWRRVPSRITRRFEGLIPLGGGIWRQSLYPAQEAWPSCWPEMERLKFLSPDRKCLFKFEGLGEFGVRARQRASAISVAGFGPDFENAGDGMIAYQFLSGKSLACEDLSSEVLDRLASYCECRAKQFRTAPMTDGKLEEMANFNFAQEFGRELNIPEGILQANHNIISDGRMQPHEWIRTLDGSLQKVDACAHGDDHFFPGPVDIAWDLAGAIVEWQMNLDAERYLAKKFHLRTGDDVTPRLSFFSLAYSIFRMAYCKMAFYATKDQSEKLRLRQAYLMYRHKAERQNELCKATLSPRTKSKSEQQHGGIMAKERDNEAQLDELGNDPAQVGPRSAGQAGDAQKLSHLEDAADESVEELADTDQAIEAATVEGIEDGADHPERPVHTHQEYGRPDDIPPRSQNKSDAA